MGNKEWGVFQDNEDFYAKGWIHIMPINDKKDHFCDIECDCEPTIDLGNAKTFN